jgi:MoaA/NifB/PqqE/SkfB family radical SAM enzyme/DNA-binding Lrp family transcriptional regulator
MHDNDFEYDVAFSFAGEDRPYVGEVASFLKGRLRIFYDAFEQVDLWGKDLYTHLDDVYRKRARYCVIFISRSYANKVWTNHERRSAQARAFEEHREYILPVRLDDTDIPGMRRTTAYVSSKTTEPERLAMMIIEKCSSAAKAQSGAASTEHQNRSTAGLSSSTTSNSNRLEVVDWRITSDCDHSCPSCFGPKGIPYLDIEQAKRLVDKLQSGGVTTICISGGEPLRYPYIDDVLKYVHENDLRIYLSTNGNHVCEHKDVIERCVSKLSLPLDGPSQDIHSRTGRSSENFSRVLSVLGHYSDKGKPFQVKVGTLLTSSNITVPRNLIRLYQLLKRYSIDIWKIYEFVPEGGATVHRNFLGYPEEFFSLTVQALYKEIKTKSPFPIVVSRRKDRNRAYFIVQPDGSAVVPEEHEGVVHESYLGNVLADQMFEIVQRWQRKVDYTNYRHNVRFVKEDDYPIVLDLLDRYVLAELRQNPTQTSQQMSETLQVRPDVIDNKIKLLHERGILKSIVPIIDVDKLGFCVFNVFLSIESGDEAFLQRIIDHLVNHPFIPWVARCSGRWTFAIAIFARHLHHYRQIMMSIEGICQAKLESYEELPVYEKYLLDQRYLFYDDKRPSAQLDLNCRVSLNRSHLADLTEQDYETLARITGYQRPSIFSFSKGYGQAFEHISADIERLKDLGVLRTFQPTCDISLLGYEWYIVLLRFRNLTEEVRMEFIEYIASYPQVTHIICCTGQWDINFEIHTIDNTEFRDIYSQIKNKFAGFIAQEDHVTILKEHKLNLLVESIFSGRPNRS